MLWWLAQNLIFAALLAGLVRLACTARRLSPAARHALWLVVLVKLLTPPLVVWPWPLPGPFPPTRTIDDSVASPAGLPEIDTGAPEPTELLIEVVASPPTEIGPVILDAPTTNDVIPADPLPGQSVTLVRHVPPPRREWSALIAPALAGLWIAGALAVALLEGTRILHMTRRARRSVPADEALTRFVADVAATLRTRPVPVRVVPGLVSPLVWAAPRPVLLWPAQLPASLPPDSLRGLIVHELAHVKRRDHWVGWLELAAAALWWWNPLAWYVRHQLRENAELACDGWVVGTLPRGRRAYAEALLAVCESLSRPATPLPAVGVSTGGRRTLERRLTMILRDRIPVQLSRGGLLAVLLLALGALPAWSQRPPGDESGLHTEVIEQPPKPVDAEPLPATGQSGAAQPATPENFPFYIRQAGTTAERSDAAQPATSADPNAAKNPLVGPNNPTRSDDSGLPADARQLLAKFDEDQSEIRREAERKLAERREELLRRLKELQDQYTRDAKLDEAVAIRDRIRQLQRPRQHRTVTTIPRGTVAPPPGDAWAREPDYRAMIWDHRHLVGEAIVLRITGRTDGTVWGTDVYTSDSDVATAAVHAGVLKPGETGTVRVKILQGADNYESSTRNGVASQSYIDWPAAYSLERHDEGTPADPASEIRGTTVPPLPALGPRSAEPGQAARFNRRAIWELRDRVGETFDFDVIATNKGSAWGTDIYTDDSDLGAAAVHAGKLRPGDHASVRIRILPGRDSYAGSARNEVTTFGFGAWEGSYTIESAELFVDNARSPQGHSYQVPRVGELFEAEIRGTKSGRAFGTDVYTGNTSLNVAAVHAGILEDGEQGRVRVTTLEGRDSYEGSTRHGVASEDRPSPWPRSYRLEPADNEGHVK